MSFGDDRFRRQLTSKLTQKQGWILNMYEILELSIHLF